MPMSILKIYPAEGTWVVRAGGSVIGESTRALELLQRDWPFVIYFPARRLSQARCWTPPSASWNATNRGMGAFFIPCL